MPKIKHFLIIPILVGAPYCSYGAAIELKCMPQNNSCSHCTKYRCASGYYGTVNSTTNNCVRCPTQQVSGGTMPSYSFGTSVIGSTEKTDCYLKDGFVGWDTTGGWVIDTGGRPSLGKPSGCYWSDS